MIIDFLREILNMIGNSLYCYVDLCFMEESPFFTFRLKFLLASKTLYIFD